MTSEIDKLKHFHVENYSGTNFTDDLNDGEEVTLLCKYVKNKHIGNCLIVYLISIFVMVFYVILLFLK